MVDVKRKRPTVAMVRELEAKLESQMEGTSQLVRDCDAWRKKYEKLNDEYKILTAPGTLGATMRKQGERIIELQNAVAVGDARISLLEEIADNRAKEVERLSAVINKLENRGFFARLFNWG